MTAPVTTAAPDRTPDPATAGRLTRLAAGGRAAQWTAEDGIDWRLEARPAALLDPTDLAVALSQLYHGELATARLCRRLMAELAAPEARACLALQVADETRHAAVYRRYLARLGGVRPLDGVLAVALEAAEAWPGSALGAVAAFHVVVEGEALRMQENLVRLFRCPLLRQINRRIARDEARHVAFGRLYLGGCTAALPAGERRAIHGWLRRLWAESAAATLDQLPERGAAGRVFLKAWLARGWARHARSLAAVGLGAGEAGP